MVNKNKISTPCINVCKMEMGFCIGCGRNVDQICQWQSYSENHRLEIMSQLFINKNATKQQSSKYN